VRSARTALLALAAVVAAACSVGSSPSTSGSSVPGQPSTGAGAPVVGQADLTIYGAASLQGVLARVKSA
jgi:hypothetical protein